MKNILFVQFRTDKTLLYERENFQKHLSEAKINFLNALEKEAIFSSPKKLLKNYQAIILGGSSEFYLSLNKEKKNNILQSALENISPLIKYILENDFPTLGVCFGHQMLGYFLGEKVIADENQAETGSFSVFLTEEGVKSPLFSEMPKSFTVQFGHRDSLEKLPEGAKLLARSKRCKIASFVYKNNIYGVQFHPEMDLEDVKLRLSLHPEYQRRNEIPLIDSPDAPKILINFLENL